MADNMEDYLSNAVHEGINAEENMDDTQREEPEEERALIKLTQIPLSRIKQIMKLDPDVHLSSQEAVFLITKSTELFIQSIAKESFTHTCIGKRKTLQRKDIDKAIESADGLAFLEGAI